MNNFINRLASFTSFPDHVLVSSVILSNSGFYYTGNQDEVECFQCHVKVKDWKEGDVPTDRHFQSSPQCPFVITLLRNNGCHPPVHSTRNEPVTKPSPNQLPCDPEVTPNPSIVEMEQNSKTKNVSVLGHNSSLGQNNQSVNFDTGQPKVHITSNTDALQVLDNQGTQGTQDSTQWYTRRDTTTQHSIGPGETDYTIERNRLASFVGNWPINSPVTPQELAAAGLYYVGPGDKVKCPYCKGGMYNWEEGDTGMGEHAKHFPQCSFVKQKISQTMHYGQNPGPGDVQQPMRNDVPNQPPNKTEDNNRRDNPAVNIALDMGYDMKLVEQAVKHLQANGKAINADTLVDELFDLENRDEVLSDPEDGATGMDPTTTSESREGVNSPNDTSSDLNKTMVRNRVSPSELTELMDENLRLKESTTCKICLENDVNTLFLPCRHLVCCEECSEAVRHCPVCRTLIVGTVKTFLS